MSQSSAKASSSSKLDPNFNPFALHPFTNGSVLTTTSTVAPRPITSSPFAQAAQYNHPNIYVPQPRRGDPTTPPGGPGPQRPVQQQAKPEPIFTSYKASGRRTPELEDVLKRSGSRWPLQDSRR
ncbi:hypothetical protein FRC03_005109 [Tulasnella sp. 419]|nr:hypothetical protein FRC02_010814 [Tulasnella sp. 418]KAG8961652.1 hypothetical protein FRC03_005109 [Tulasnella sp. 419]